MLLIYISSIYRHRHLSAFITSILLSVIRNHLAVISVLPIFFFFFTLLSPFIIIIIPSSFRRHSFPRISRFSRSIALTITSSSSFSAFRPVCLLSLFSLIIVLYILCLTVMTDSCHRHDVAIIHIPSSLLVVSSCFSLSSICIALCACFEFVA